MIVKITSDREVTFPARALEGFGLGPGDQLELEEVPGGFILRSRQTGSRPRKIDESLLGYLADQIAPDHPPFDLEKIRREGYDPSLRD